MAGNNDGVPETRYKISHFENFLNYDIAFALYSHGDVIRIVNDPVGRKKGILLADTIGHEPEYGTSFREYIDDIVFSGWGLGNIEDELVLLSKQLHHSESEKMIPEVHPTGLYVVLQPDRFSLSNAGMPKPIFMDAQSGKFVKINSFGRFLDGYEDFHSPPYVSAMGMGDILFLRSDGVDDGFYRRMLHKYEGDVNVNGMIAGSIKRNSHLSAEGILESIISDHGKYFIPKSYKDDDSSLMIIKKN